MPTYRLLIDYVIDSKVYPNAPPHLDRLVGEWFLQGAETLTSARLVEKLTAIQATAAPVSARQFITIKTHVTELRPDLSQILTDLSATVQNIGMKGGSGPGWRIGLSGDYQYPEVQMDIEYKPIQPAVYDFAVIGVRLTSLPTLEY